MDRQKRARFRRDESGAQLLLATREAVDVFDDVDLIGIRLMQADRHAVDDSSSTKAQKKPGGPRRAKS
jgi:hypothetical protein